ncbi:uncharacterized, partial [Tachysurus ichikawai]
RALPLPIQPMNEERMRRVRSDWPITSVGWFCWGPNGKALIHLGEPLTTERKRARARGTDTTRFSNGFFLMLRGEEKKTFN